MDEKQLLLVKHQNLELGEESLKAKAKRVWYTDCLPCIPARYMLALVSCLGFVNVYALRVNLSVAIVQMDNSTTTVLRNDSAKVSKEASQVNL